VGALFAGLGADGGRASFLFGVFFSVFYPARRAAGLDPVEALRSQYAARA
jgi:hypothetical protein